MIDNDSEASKKKTIIAKIKEYFGEDKVLNIITFSKFLLKLLYKKPAKD